MGAAIQVVSGYATNPSTTITTLTAAPGDSFTVASFPSTSQANLFQSWAENSTGGVVRIRSPRMHDAVQGIRLQVSAGEQINVLPLQAWQTVYPNDPLTVETSGGASETDIFAYMIYYQNLPGVDQQLATWPQIQGQIINLMGVELDLTSGTTAGQYGGSRTLNQDYQQMKSGYTYALLGYTVQSKFATLGIRGPDTGNTRIAGPGSTDNNVTAGWFVYLSNALGQPCIPLIQANNAGATVVDLTSTDTSTAHTVSLIFAQLNS